MFLCILLIFLFLDILKGSVCSIDRCFPPMGVCSPAGVPMGFDFYASSVIPLLHLTWFSNFLRGYDVKPFFSKSYSSMMTTDGNLCISQQTCQVKPKKPSIH